MQNSTADSERVVFPERLDDPADALALALGQDQRPVAVTHNNGVVEESRAGDDR